MQSISPVLSHPGPLWAGVVAPDRILSIGQIELFHIKQCKEMIYAKLNC